MSVAIAEYERATQIDPEYGEAFAQLAMAYATVLQRGWRLGNLAADALYASGWAAAERARLTTPDVPVVWLARASLLELRYPRSFQGALSSYQHAAVLQPSSSEVYRRYGTALLQLGDETGAETQLRHAEELDPQECAHQLRAGASARAQAPPRRSLPSAQHGDRARPAWLGHHRHRVLERRHHAGRDAHRGRRVVDAPEGERPRARHMVPAVGRSAAQGRDRRAARRESDHPEGRRAALRLRHHGACG